MQMDLSDRVKNFLTINQEPFFVGEWWEALDLIKEQQRVIENLNDSCESFMKEIGKEVTKNRNLQNKLDIIESCVVHTYQKNGEILTKTIEDIINGTITGLLPEHNTESDNCWCNPKIEEGLVIHNEITKN